MINYSEYYCIYTLIISLKKMDFKSGKEIKSVMKRTSHNFGMFLRVHFHIFSTLVKIYKLLIRYYIL